MGLGRTCGSTVSKSIRVHLQLDTRQQSMLSARPEWSLPPLRENLGASPPPSQLRTRWPIAIPWSRAASRSSLRHPEWAAAHHSEARAPPSVDREKSLDRRIQNRRLPPRAPERVHPHPRHERQWP